MRPNQARYRAGRSKGFTLIELLVVVAIIALLISILLPSLARARELSKRSVCAANLSGMGKGFYTYANENNDDWPVATYQKGSPSAGLTVVQYGQMIGNDDPGRGNTGLPACGDSNNTSCNPRADADSAKSTRLSTTRNIYRLVQSNVSAPKSFICPSSDDQAANEDNPQDYWDFGKGDTDGTPTLMQYGEAWTTISYGYQMPYSSLGRPSSDRDPAMPLASDKGPYGAAVDGGKTAVPAFGNVNASSSPEDWKPFNSPNHGGVGQGEGQNILFADSHADWASKPTAGLGSDNIFTRWSTGTGSNWTNVKELGSQPTSATSKFAPYGHTDTLIWP